MVQYSDGEQVSVADIPGLIEGAAEGAGLGHQFLRHLQRTRLLLHLVDMQPPGWPLTDDPESLKALVAHLAEGIKALVAELKAYDASLAKKPRWLVLNKSDLLSDDAREAIRVALTKKLRTKMPVYVVSGVSRQGCEDLMRDIQQWLDAERIAEIASATPDVRFLETPADDQ